MRIAVYSGSFDPLHIGHLAVMEELSRDREFGWIYLVVSPQSPFKHESLALSGRRRYQAAVEAVSRYPQLRVSVDDIELHMPPPHYTIRTLDALKEREPDNEFTLVIGADNLDSMRRWKDYRRLLLEYGVAVYPREGYDVQLLEQQLHDEDSRYRIQIIDAPLCNISSTQIREAQERGADISGCLM